MAESDELRVFPQRLHHAVPAWACAGSCFHIRLRVAPANLHPLTQPDIARTLLDSVRHYHDHLRWHCLLFLLMPDHAHALLAFPLESRMSRAIGEWKHYAAHRLDIRWQSNYFDHRIRSDSSLAEKCAYILRNPVAKGLCAREADWPWAWKPPNEQGASE